MYEVSVTMGHDEDLSFDKQCRSTYSQRTGWCTRCGVLGLCYGISAMQVVNPRGSIAMTSCKTHAYAATGEAYTDIGTVPTRHCKI